MTAMRDGGPAKPAPGTYDMAMQDLAEAQPAPAPGSALRRQMDQDRILAKLKGLWHRLPELRLGQLIENARSMAGGQGPDAFYTPDADLERGIEALHDEFVVKRGQV